MKKVGVLTIGQSPRTDIMDDIGPMLQGSMKILEAGAIDGMSLEEVRLLAPGPEDTVLVSRMRDGTGVTLSEEKILPLMQKQILDLEQQGAATIMLLCTGEFPETFISNVPLIYPSKVIVNIVAALNGVSHIGVITPDAGQAGYIEEKWLKVVPKVSVGLWNPYYQGPDSPEAAEAVKQLKAAGADLLVMDCFGYSRKMKELASETSGCPVILSRSIAARVLLELV